MTDEAHQMVSKGVTFALPHKPRDQLERQLRRPFLTPNDHIRLGVVKQRSAMLRCL